MNTTSHSVTMCPECHSSITFYEEPRLHHLLLCPHCEVILVVSALRPLQLDWAFEEPLLPGDPSYPVYSAESYWHLRPRP